MSDIVERLNGIYRIPITDGLGVAGGEEPDNPNEFVRTFEATPIQKEAAAEITALRAALASKDEEVKRLREAVLAFQDYGCPICQGDCSSANPPVSSCPMQLARTALLMTKDDKR